MKYPDNFVPMFIEDENGKLIKNPAFSKEMKDAWDINYAKYVTIFTGEKVCDTKTTD